MSRFGLPNFVKSLIHTGLDFLFPWRCLGCRREGRRLCQNCLNDLPRCVWSGENEIVSVFDYNSPLVKQAVWALKYRHGPDLAEIFARPLEQTLNEELADRLILPEGKIVLVPVPLSPRRRRQRGYNQAEILAEKLVELNPDRFELQADLIKKIKDTPPQATLKRRALRLANLKGAFAPAGGAPAGGRLIVIVDDVATTGATIGEIRKILQQQDCHRVWGLTIAHG